MQTGDETDQRALLTSNAPHVPSLLFDHAELSVAMDLFHHGELLTFRYDRPISSVDVVSATASQTYRGAVRLLDRGMLRLLRLNEVNAVWGWSDLDAEADALRHIAAGLDPDRQDPQRGYPHDLANRPLSGPETALALSMWPGDDNALFHEITPTPGQPGYINVTTLTTGTSPPSSYTRTIAAAHHMPDGGYSPVFGGTSLLRGDARYCTDMRNWLFTYLSNTVAPALYGDNTIRIDARTFRVTHTTLDPGYHTYTKALPVLIQDSLAVLNAPLFLTQAEFINWAENNLTYTVACSMPDEPSTAVKHTLVVDPHTSQTTAIAPSRSERSADLDAIHLMQGLTGNPARCVAAGAYVKEGHLIQARSGDIHKFGGHTWSADRVDRLTSITRVCHVMAAIDEGQVLRGGYFIPDARA